MIEFAPMLILDWLASILVFFALFVSTRALNKRASGLSRKRKYGLFMLHFICFTALLGLILQPQVRLGLGGNNNKNRIANDKVRLITSNLEFASVDSIVASGYPTYALVKITSGLPIYRIQSLDQILVKHPDLTEIEIIGDGLMAHDLKRFKDIKISYQIPSLKPGLVDVSWSKKINQGDTLTFSARFQGVSNSLLTAQLFDPAGDKVAEKKVRAGEFFRLSSKPKLAGLHQYKIKLIGNKKELVDEGINLQVMEESQAKLLVLQSSPSFEIKQLQNWAAENGASLMVKTKISHNKYQTRLTNFSASSSTTAKVKLSPSLLGAFDILIVDGRGFVELSSKESDWVELAVKDGLGLLILADQELAAQHRLNPSRLLSGIQIEKKIVTSEVVPYWINRKGTLEAVTQELISKVPLSIQLLSNQNTNIQRLAVSENNELLIHQNDFGLGRIALSLIKSSHQWVTSGNKNIHAQFWSSLIAHIARRENVALKYSVDNDTLDFVGVLTKQCINSKQKTKQLIFNHQQVASLQQSALLQRNLHSKDESCGYIWPRMSGWYQLMAKQDLDKSSISHQGSWRYIESRNSWHAMQQSELIKATLARQSMNSSLQPIIRNTQYVQINLWYFWWMFFISASLIWLERKFD